MSEFEDLEKRVTQLEGAVIALQNMIMGPKHEEPTAAETEGKLLADLDPTLVELIEVYDANGETRVKCKKYIHQRNKWTEIHQYLMDRQFKWESKGKDSYWHRRG